jgi:hypothetical protein
MIDAAITQLCRELVQNSELTDFKNDEVMRVVSDILATFSLAT